MMMRRLILALAACLYAAPAFAAECRTESDRIGAGMSWTQCDGGYRSEEQRDIIGAGTIHGSDNRGHSWVTRRSRIVPENSWTEMK